MATTESSHATQQWANASQATRKQAKKVFALPKDIKRILLPSRNTSISEMLAFSAPPSSVVKSTTELASFFSSQQPQDLSKAEVLQLSSLPMPHLTVIRELDVFSRQGWMDGMKSVTYAHSPGQKTRFPLWIISFWMTVSTLRSTVWKPWQRIDTWLQKQECQFKSTSRREFASLTRALLAAVPWKLPKQGLSDVQPIHTIWRLLGETWTNSTVQDNMLDILRIRAAANDPLSSRFLIENVDFTTKLFEASNNWDDYNDNRSWGWLRDIGHQIFRDGKTLVTIIHLRKVGKEGGGSLGSTRRRWDCPALSLR